MGYITTNKNKPERDKPNNPKSEESIPNQTEIKPKITNTPKNPEIKPKCEKYPENPRNLSVKVKGEKVTNLKAFLARKKLKRDKCLGNKPRLSGQQGSTTFHQNRAASTDDSGENTKLPNQTTGRQLRGNRAEHSAEASV